MLSHALAHRMGHLTSEGGESHVVCSEGCTPPLTPAECDDDRHWLPDFNLRWMLGDFVLLGCWGRLIAERLV
eukprot:3519790-Amphidinium_carterae.2